MWQQWTNGILGIWLIVLPFLNLTITAFVWTLIFTGLAVAVFGFWGAIEHQSHEHGHMGTRSHA
jgi:hypothetical protein